MLESKLHLQFKDNIKKIEFDLNNNTVFFGNNGQGKTRILKTINSLYLLAKEKRKGNFSKIIDSMNLKELNINGVNYNELFSVNENLKETEKKKFFLYLEDNKNILEELYFILQDIPSEIIYEVESKSRFKNILNYLNKCLTVFSKSKGNPYLEGYDRWLNDSYYLMIKLRNTIVHNRFDFDSLENEKSPLTYLEEAINLISYLREKYQFLDYYSKEEELIERITQNKENILKSLSVKSAHYITTDNIEIMNISKRIEVFINEINEELKIYFWSNSANLNNVDELALLLEKRNALYSKVKKFNKTMKKYTDIKIDIQKNHELLFIKNKEEMAFEKLSSGERKIAFLFLEILFHEVDIYLIDEPELSLSLNFQNKIITDLHLLTKGKTLFIATHAPYIYEDFIAIEGNTSKEV